MATTTSMPTPLPLERSFSDMGWRIAASILSVFGLAIFLLLYFAFWTGSYTGVQSAVLVVVAILVFVAVNASAWASWGLRYGRRAEARGWP